MNWEDARLFLAVARAGQMLGAARSLGVNQATLSRRLTALESDLGTRLLFRSTTGCQLTESGQKLKKALEAAEGPILSAVLQLSGTELDMSGTVRIGAPDGFGVSFLAPQLPRLMDLHPSLRLELVPVSRTFSLSQREADIAVLIGRPSQGRLVVRKLTDYSLSLYATPDYLAQRGTPKDIEDLSAHRLVGYVEDLIPTPELNFEREISKSWRNALAISSAMGQFEAVRAGAGIGILHDYIASEAEDLVRVLPEITISRAYWTAVHENLRSSPQVAAVSRFLTKVVEQSRERFRSADWK
ncbi:MAG: LysR family transcriptional regulator [Hyphomicrobiaceae bacterium]|nr:LysR family transcriptional regulator [Hyphomicrobiaceae bacterium]